MPRSLQAMFDHPLHSTPIISREELAALGKGEIAYLKPIRSENAREVFPDLMLEPGFELFAVYGADGIPLMVTADRYAAQASAAQFHLDTVSLH